jgi:hypothetical protein
MYFGLDVFCMIKARATEIDMLYTFTAAQVQYFRGRASGKYIFVSILASRRQKTASL